MDDDFVLSYPRSEDEENNVRIKQEPIHEAEKVLILHPCKHCRATFPVKEALNRHMLFHENKLKNFKYRCRCCSNRYMTPKLLFGHYRRKHPKEKPFNCCVCEEFFDKHVVFSKHLLQIHGNKGSVRFDSENFIVFEPKNEGNEDDGNDGCGDADNVSGQVGDYVKEDDAVKVSPTNEKNPVIERSSAVKRHLDVETSSAVEASSVVETSSDNKMSSAVEVSLDVESSSNVEISPAVKVSSAVETNSATDINSAVEVSSVIETSSAIEKSPALEIHPVAEVNLEDDGDNFMEEDEDGCIDYERLDSSCEGEETDKVIETVALGGDGQLVVEAEDQVAVIVSSLQMDEIINSGAKGKGSLLKKIDRQNKTLKKKNSGGRKIKLSNGTQAVKRSQRLRKPKLEPDMDVLEDSDKDYDEHILNKPKVFARNISKTLKATGAKKNPRKTDPIKKFKCHLCKKGFKMERKLHKHVKAHFENDKLLCPCGVKFEGEVEFEQHREECRKKRFLPFGRTSSELMEAKLRLLANARKFLKKKMAIAEKEAKKLRAKNEKEFETNKTKKGKEKTMKGGKQQKTRLRKRKSKECKETNLPNKKKQLILISESSSDDECLIDVKRKALLEKAVVIIPPAGSAVSTVTKKTASYVPSYKLPTGSVKKLPPSVVLRKISEQEALDKKNKMFIKAVSASSANQKSQVTNTNIIQQSLFNSGYDYNNDDFEHNDYEDFEDVMQGDEDNKSVSEVYQVTDEQYQVGNFLIHVNPLQHLLPSSLAKPIPRKSDYKPKTFDYVSIIEKELKHPTPRMPTSKERSYTPKKRGRKSKTEIKANNAGKGNNSEADVREVLTENEHALPEYETVLPESENNSHEIENNPHEVENNSHDIENNSQEIESNAHEIVDNLADMESSLPEIDSSLPEIEGSLQEIENSLSDIGSSLPMIETGLPEL